MTKQTGPAPTRVDFGRVAQEYEATRGIPESFMNELVEDIIHTCNLQQDSLVLELGCGTGRFLRAFSHRKISAIGLDISRGMLEQACSKQHSQKNYRSNLIAGDAASIPLNQGLFKVILAIHIFHLMTDWRDALSETLHVLQPDGTLVSGHVGAVTYQSFLNKFYRKRREELGYSATPLGVDPSEIVMALKTKGAHIETHNYTMKVQVPLQLTLKYLEQRVFSSMWRDLPDIIHRQIMKDVRQAATTQFKNLDDAEQIKIDAQLHFIGFG